MAFHVTNTKVEAAVRRFAQQRKLKLTDAIGVAVAEATARPDRDRVILEEVRSRIDELQAAVASLMDERKTGDR